MYGVGLFEFVLENFGSEGEHAKTVLCHQVTVGRVPT